MNASCHTYETKLKTANRVRNRAPHIRRETMASRREVYVYGFHKLTQKADCKKVVAFVHSVCEGATGRGIYTHTHICIYI